MKYIYFFLFFSIAAKASLTPLNLDKELKTLKSFNAFDVPPTKSVTPYSPLAQVKIYEIRKNYEACYKQGLKLLSKSEIKEWLALAVLQCASLDPQKSSLAKVVKDLKSISVAQGPWKNAWGEAWAQAHIYLIESATGIAQKQSWLDSWAVFWEFMSKENQARWFETKANLSLKDKKTDDAAFFFKQSYDLVPNPRALSASVAVPSVLKAEAEQDEKIQKLVGEGRLLKAQARMVDYIKDFPQGRSAKKYKDRILEIYAAQTGDSQDESLKNLLAADNLRMLEWAQVLHRRLDYKATLALCEEALPSLRQTTQATSGLWMAGRSAQFLGKYDKALNFFDELIQSHSGTEESYEALFRSGLILYRQENYLKTAEMMERLRGFSKAGLKTTDKYELNAWYWQIRALEKSGDAVKASEERDRLVERFPFSYYGLRLRAEKKNGLIAFTEKNSLPSEMSPIYLLPAQAASWKRFKILVQNGWIIEAQQELSMLPQPASTEGLWKWVQLLSKATQHQAASLVLNRLLESEESFRHPDYLNIIFPKDYSQWIEAESKKYFIDPDLIRGLIRQESAFSLRAVSTSNALGLMQMIPPTAEEVSKKMKLKIQIPQDMYRPEINIPMGTFYVADMLEQFSKNVPMALGAYNAGPHRLKAWMELRENIWSLRTNHSSQPIDELWFDELPWTETSFYIKAILRNILVYRLVDKSPVVFKPIFWSDLILKKTDTAASAIVK